MMNPAPRHWCIRNGACTTKLVWLPPPMQGEHQSFFEHVIECELVSGLFVRPIKRRRPVWRGGRKISDQGLSFSA